MIDYIKRPNSTPQASGQVGMMIDALKDFGRFRESDNSRDMFQQETFGFTYVHESTLTAVIFRKTNSCWLLETAACARDGLKPSIELFRLVARWNTTTSIVTSNVVEDGLGRAAVLVGGTVSIEALDLEFSGRQYVSTLIDVTNSVSRCLGGELEQFGGVYLEEAGTSIGSIADRVHALWKVEDKKILDLIQQLD